MTEWYTAYVRHEDVAAYRAIGWSGGDDIGGHHADFSIIMTWLHGEPVRTPHAPEKPADVHRADGHIHVEGDEVLRERDDISRVSGP